MLYYLDNYLHEWSVPSIKSIIQFVDPTLGKKSLSKDLITVCCIGVVASAMALLEITKKDLGLTSEIYSKLQMQYMEQLNPTISDFGATLSKLEKEMLSRTKNKIKKETIIEMATGYKESVYLEGLRKLLRNGYISKDILNSLIDLTNCYLGSFLHNCVFVTEENKWIDLVMESNNKGLSLSKDFYRTYFGR